VESYKPAVGDFEDVLLLDVPESVSVAREETWLGAGG
jgi:hypothetical protein